MKKDAREIYDAFRGKLIGTDELKQSVCGVLALMDKNIIDYVTATCWFIGSMDDAYAFTFTGNDLKDNHLIFLSDELFLYDQSQINYTIAHEIGHVILKHRNATLVKQSKKEIYHQETTADAFAKRYVKE